MRYSPAQAGGICFAGPAQAPIAVLPPFAAGVTAVAFTDIAVQRQSVAHCLLAVGLEIGEIQVWSVTLPAAISPANSQPPGCVADGDAPAAKEDSATEAQVKLVWQPKQHDRHTAAVKRLCWRTVADSQWQLASCSDDHAVRVFDIAWT